MAAASHYYVWYRLAGEPAQAREAITAMMLQVALETGVAGRVRVRADDRATWMEIYEDVAEPEGFERALAEAVAEHHAEALADGGRHVECFRDCGDA
jgi:hypothetical protein